MAEAQRIASPLVPEARPRPLPKLPHPVRYAAPLRLPLDETQDLRPPVTAAEPVSLRQVQELEPEDRDLAPAKEPPAGRGRRARTAPLRSRTPREWALLTVLLLGLGLNAAVLLLNSGLTRADVLLGATVLLAGVVLLALMEVCRRGGLAPR
jgi:hypothetical protein